MEAVLETKDVWKSFHHDRKTSVHAVAGVTLTIPEGSLCALAGPSGSGKTTLLSLLGALDRPSSGQLLFRGRDVSRFSDVELARTRRRTGFVFQEFALLRGLSVLDNITYPLIPRGVPRAERMQAATQQLERFGIAHCAGKRPEQLSGGERQRVAVARALAGQPEVLFADEPTANLDQQAGSELADVLTESHSAGMTIVLATHEARLLALATTVFHLDSGRLQGPGNEGD